MDKQTTPTRTHSSFVSHLAPQPSEPFETISLNTKYLEHTLLTDTDTLTQNF